MEIRNIVEDSVLFSFKLIINYKNVGILTSRKCSCCGSAVLPVSWSFANPRLSNIAPGIVPVPDKLHDLIQG